MSKFILIGGGTGIGAALAEMLSEAGNEVMVLSRSGGGRQAEGKVSYGYFDVLDENAQLPELNGPLKGLIYLPGSINLKPFRALKLADFRSEMELNFIGAVRCIQHFLPNLKEAAGSIILFSTVAVQRGMPFHAGIASAKGAIEGLTRSLAAELAPTIRVNAIAPSLTETPLAMNLLNSDAKKEASAARHPMKRVGSPEDIAEMASFLLSEKATWITGQIIGVDGGLSAI